MILFAGQALPFVIVGGVGVVLLLVSLIVGDLLDAMDIGDGFVSGFSLGTALTIFGLAGLITVQNGLPVYFAYILGAVLGALALLLVAMLTRRLRASETGAGYSPLGFTGVTRTRVSPAGGEVALDDHRELERRLAYSREPIEPNTRITVVAVSGARVEVRPEG